MRKITVIVFWACLSAGIPWAAADPGGAALYERHCAACHGSAGEGGVGVPLALPSLMGSVTNEYLSKTIRYGRPGRVMPPNPDMSEAQIAAIVDYVRALSGVPEPSFSKRPVKGDTVRGAGLYAQHCARCHGEKGEGSPGTGVTLSRPRELAIMAPALNNEGFLRSASDAMIRHVVAYGREGTPMVSFLERGLAEGEINDIVSFVRAFEGGGFKARKQGDEAPILIAKSPYSLEQTLENVRQAVVDRNFRIIRVQYLEDGLLPEGEQNHRQVIVYFCNFSFLSQALKIDPRVGIFLPCRVTLVERNGQVEVMSVNPLRVMAMFNNENLKEHCDHMLRVYKELLEEAVL